MSLLTIRSSVYSLTLPFFPSVPIAVNNKYTLLYPCALRKLDPVKLQIVAPQER